MVKFKMPGEKRKKVIDHIDMFDKSRLHQLLKSLGARKIKFKKE